MKIILHKCKRMASFSRSVIVNGCYLRGHFLDLRVGQGLNSEVVILMKLIFDKFGFTQRIGNKITVHNLIARQLQKVKSADSIVALVFRLFKPLLYLFSEFVVHK